MTDYLEEHLKRAENLLEQVRRMEDSGSGLSQDFHKKSGDFEANNQNISDKGGAVDVLKTEVNRTAETVDVSDGTAADGAETPKKSVNYLREEVDKPPLPSRQPAVAGAEEGEAVKPGQAGTNVERAKKNSPPLAVQLEELNRAVSVLTAGGLEERGPAAIRQGQERVRRSRPAAAYPDLAGEKEENWRGGVSTSSSATGGALDWAEQADRVFRRDSRRYDGGFSLY